MKLLDTEMALEQVQGDEEFLNELYQIFLTEIPERLSSFESALQEGDGKKVTGLAHSLKGVSLTIGASSCKMLAEEIEQAATRGELDEARELYGSLKKVMGELHKSISGMIQDN